MVNRDNLLRIYHSSAKRVYVLKMACERYTRNKWHGYDMPPTGFHKKCPIIRYTIIITRSSHTHAIIKAWHTVGPIMKSSGWHGYGMTYPRPRPKKHKCKFHT